MWHDLAIFVGANIVERTLTAACGEIVILCKQLAHQRVEITPGLDSVKSRGANQIAAADPGEMNDDVLLVIDVEKYEPRIIFVCQAALGLDLHPGRDKR